MSEVQPKCGLCGQAMPKGEEMFKYHGYSGPCPELPELTDEERAALHAMDMTEILGTWEDRFHVAKNAAMRWLRERNEARQRLANVPEGWNDLVRERDEARQRLAAAEAARDDARDAARWLYQGGHAVFTPSEAREQWPWLADDPQ